MRYTRQRHYRQGRHVEARIAGIPCLVRVVHYASSPDTRGEQGYVDIDYVVCDRKGYPAEWLARKMDPKAQGALEAHLIEQLS